MMKYEETFYGRHTVLNTRCSEIKSNLKINLYIYIYIKKLTIVIFTLNIRTCIRTHILRFIKSCCAGLSGSAGCAVRLETRRSRVQPRRGRQHSFVEIDHEIFSTVILSLPLVPEGQLSVSRERMCTILVNRLDY